MSNNERPEFTNREMFLMRDVAQAIDTYGDIDQYLDTVITDDGYTVAQNLADDAERLYGSATEKPTRLIFSKGFEAGQKSVSVPESWRSTMKELSDDLESEIESRRSSEIDRRVERDLIVVKEARALLAAQEQDEWLA